MAPEPARTTGPSTGRSVEPSRRQRADAQRNVVALMEAAKTVFAGSGVDAPAKEITDLAGVGVGTLYRHFPRRSDLIVAVLQHEIDEDTTHRPAPAGPRAWLPGQRLGIRYRIRPLAVVAAKSTAMAVPCPTSVRHAGGVARGVVKFFKEEKGWGAIDSSELPDGQDAWVHFSVIEGDGYRALDAGDVVDFDYERARQDSFTFRATRARRVAPGPAPALRRVGKRVVIADDGTPDTPLTPKRHC